METSKTAIVVAGMHRSGTSAFARTMSLLGCDLPRTLMKATPDNERGHWESSAIAAINNAILTSLGSSWDDHAEIDPDWYRTSSADDFRGRALDLLGQEFGDSPQFVMKDPRVCRLLPFWLDVLDAFGAAPVVISPIRNPLEVAASLRVRDGMEPSIGYLLWLRHVLDAEAGSRGRQRAFFRYADLVDEWEATADRLADRLDLSWPSDAAAADSAIRRFLSPALRHQDLADEKVLADRSLPGSVRETFAILNRWAADDVRTGDSDALDRIKADFDRSDDSSAAPAASGSISSAELPRIAGKATKTPLLSIAIPAYDRPRELEYGLLKFIAQAVLDYGDLIEIIVTDDATPDDNLRGVRERTSIYPFVHFDRNPTNIGLEQNLIHCTRRCTGEYLWIFGDDDFLEAANSLDEIMAHLGEGMFDFYVLNRTRRSFALDTVISSNWMQLDPGENVGFSGLREFCLAYSLISVIGFISVDIFRRAPFAAIDPQPYFGTMYPQVGVMLEAFHDRPVLLIGKPLICHRTQTHEEKRAALGQKKLEADYMSGDLSRRRAIYYSHPLARMLDRLLDVGALQPDDIGRIKEITEFNGGLLIDLLILAVGLSKDRKDYFSDADWARTRQLFDRISLDDERRERITNVLEGAPGGSGPG